MFSQTLPAWLSSSDVPTCLAKYSVLKKLLACKANVNKSMVQ